MEQEKTTEEAKPEVLQELKRLEHKLGELCESVNCMDVEIDDAIERFKSVKDRVVRLMAEKAELSRSLDETRARRARRGVERRRRLPPRGGMVRSGGDRGDRGCGRRVLNEKKGGATMNRATYEELKNSVDFGDVYFVDENGETRNVRAFYVDGDGQIWLAEDPANMEARG